MRAVVQRVAAASVDIDGERVGSIGPGLLVYLGVGKDDTDQDVDYLVRKLSSLRIFNDDDGRMNLDVRNTGGSFLVVSQFTLWADTRKGRRPSYNSAALPETATPLYELFIQKLRGEGFVVHSGRFGASMVVNSSNDGPVTLTFDTHNR